MIVQTPGLGLEAGRLGRVPTGDDVDVADPTLLTDAQYATAAATTCSYRATEYGNAQRLAVLFGEDLRYVRSEKQWYVWQGSHWAPDGTGELMRRAKTVARLLWSEVPLVGSHERDDRVRHAKRSETRQGLQAMIELAASEKVTAGDGSVITLTCSPDDFDHDRYLINCTNGTLDLRAGKLRAHRREDMQRRIAPAPYKPRARSKRWERFLLESTGGDRELVDYLQLLAGASLLGTNNYDLVPVIFGPPGSGKSTFIRAVLAALGPQYADTASLETFVERQASSAARDDLARLEGLRLVACVEGERNHTLAVGLLKQISGGDAVSARRIYQATRTWTPEMTVWIAVNERPRVPRDEAGMWRRVKAIPFENQVVIADPNLRDALSDPHLAGPAVLAWMVQGARRLLKLTGPIVDPPAVVEATQDYRQEQAPSELTTWIQTCCRAAGDDVVTLTSELRASYQRWCSENGAPVKSSKAWGEELGQRFKRGRRSTGRFYRGIEVLDGLAGPSDDQDPLPTADEPDRLSAVVTSAAVSTRTQTPR